MFNLGGEMLVIDSFQKKKKWGVLVLCGERGVVIKSKSYVVCVDHNLCNLYESSELLSHWIFQILYA